MRLVLEEKLAKDKRITDALLNFRDAIEKVRISRNENRNCCLVGELFDGNSLHMRCHGAKAGVNVDIKDIDSMVPWLVKTLVDAARQHGYLKFPWFALVPMSGRGFYTLKSGNQEFLPLFTSKENAEDYARATHAEVKIGSLETPKDAHERLKGFEDDDSIVAVFDLKQNKIEIGDTDHPISGLLLSLELEIHGREQ